MMNNKSVIKVLLIVSLKLVTGSSFHEGRPSADVINPELEDFIRIWDQSESIPIPVNQTSVILTSARRVWGDDEDSQVDEIGRDDDEDSQVDDIGRDDLIDAIRELEEAADEEEALLNRDPPPVNLTSEYRDHDELLPEDLSELPEDIVDDITAGVEESLLLSGNVKKSNESKFETRQFPIYMFQGSYMAEPRLNRFIDGAIRNMGTELRISIMDPLFFRVLPKGKVESRPKPVKKVVVGREARATFFNKFGKKIMNRMYPFKRKKKGGQRRRPNNRRRKKPIRRRPGQGKRKTIRRKVIKRKPGRLPVIRRRKPIRNNNNRNKNNRNKNRKKRPGNNKNRKKNKNRRQKRRVRRHVGGGRVEGLSCITRDGDAEMQVFGNFTLVRSHMKMGPVELAMQFRTRKGLRRTGASLPFVRAHTVTRVSQDGSEMVDFLLDRPHPESIKVRGRLFPLAQRIARNIFSRLFVPNSFLTSQLREKASLALLSKPKK